MEDNLVGVKELFDVSIRLNEAVDIGNQHYDINESILNFERADIAQFYEQQSIKEARGGYHNNLLMDWVTDTQANFAISNGVLSPTTWSILSNSKVGRPKTKSISYKEQVPVIEDGDRYFCVLKFIPNAVPEQLGLQGNPEGEQMPMGRKPWLPLKPLPPQSDKYIFCYDKDTGKKILNFQVCGNQIIFAAEHRGVVVDYTFNYEDKIVELEVGNRLFKDFLRLTGKMTVKDYFTGEPKTAILEIPKIKIRSSLAMKLGTSYNTSVVSDFSFIGYPPEDRLDERICNITFLETELTGDYL